MKPEELERMIHAARDYNEPPDVPREEMWEAIRSELPRRRTDELSARRRARARCSRWGTPWAIGLAAAATLAVGFGLGRLTRDTTPAPASAPVAVERSAPSTPVRLATAEHMSDAEALLTLFQAASATTSTGDRAATADWARDLLSTTRVLLDSRVADDPEMASLLADLELVLVQIASAGGDRDDELIGEGIRQQQLMAKLRTAAAPADISL